MEDLDALKGNPRVIQIYGKHVRLKRSSNKSYVGLCPLSGHTEKSPSFNVYDDGKFSCFGCGRSGNIFQFLEDVLSIEFKAAVEIVKNEVGHKSSWEESKQKVESTFKAVAEPKTCKTIPLSAWKKLEDALANSPEAIHYLDKERGITLATAQQLRLGFAQNIGSLAGQDGADIADKGWIALPCICGDVITSIKYRSIAAKKFSRQPGMATALWNTETIDVFEPLYVTEGEFDACVLEQAGFRAVSVPSAGTKLTPEMKDLLMKSSMVVLSGDTDDTGSGYMQKLWKELGERTYLLTWPEGCKDGNQTWLDYSKRDPLHFKTTVEELTQKAKSQPMPDIYSIQEVMQNGEDTSLADRADRLRFPWANVDQMAILLPGSVLGLTSTNTSMGKTPFAIQSTLFGARKYQEVVVNWQCELSPAEISVIVSAQVLRKNRNFLSRDDQKQAAEQLQGVQYYIGNNPTITDIMSVLDILEAAIRRCGATIAVLDNLHFYTTGIDDENRVQTAAIKRIKQIAGQYGVKFIVVGQPRKASAQSKGKKTHITDAKGSGSFGDTCDSFMAIHRELTKEEGKNDIYEEKTLVEMLKTRSKGIGKSSAFLHFFGEFACFDAIENNYPEPEGGENGFGDD